MARNRRLVVGLCAVALVAASAVRVTNQTAATTKFARLVEELSEPGGEFDTDNLISNERSYLHVVPALEQDGVSGGAYLGVGPDQNFSYIARIRPTTAFIVDIRRDNLLLHLLFKALFSMSTTRVEYLTLLTGRPAPDRVESWRDAPIERLVAYVDGAKPQPAATLDRRLHETITRFGVPLAARDFATIDRFHAAFIDSGLSLQFQSYGRPPREYYPTLRDLLLESDRKGRKLNYLASEADFQFVRGLENADEVIPVVGDLSGPHAVAAIGQLLAQRNERVSAFYVSNVEMYLFREGAFPKFIDNLNRLPHGDHSVIIRSIFGGYPLADSVPGYYSTSTVQNLGELLANYASGRYRTYSDIVLKR